MGGKGGGVQLPLILTNRPLSVCGQLKKGARPSARGLGGYIVFLLSFQIQCHFYIMTYYVIMLLHFIFVMLIVL